MTAIEIKGRKIWFKLDPRISKTIPTLPYMYALNFFYL